MANRVRCLPAVATAWSLAPALAIKEMSVVVIPTPTPKAIIVRPEKGVEQVITVMIGAQHTTHGSDIGIE